MNPGDLGFIKRRVMVAGMMDDLIVPVQYMAKGCALSEPGDSQQGESTGGRIILSVADELGSLLLCFVFMLDCGLFIMNLVYAFYEKQIGTCILNGSFNLEREKDIRKVTPIPDNEMYAAIIALSRIPDGEDILVAHSVKREVENIVEVL